MNIFDILEKIVMTICLQSEVADPAADLFYIVGSFNQWHVNHLRVARNDLSHSSGGKRIGFPKVTTITS